MIWDRGVENSLGGWKKTEDLFGGGGGRTKKWNVIRVTPYHGGCNVVYVWLSFLIAGSKLLSSLLESESYQYLKKICDRLDTTMAGAGDYRDVCSYYGIDRYGIASIYEKQRDGPSRALIDYLAATHEQLTVAEFVTVVRKVAKRGDVAKLLEEYEEELWERMARFFHYR